MKAFDTTAFLIFMPIGFWLIVTSVFNQELFSLKLLSGYILCGILIFYFDFSYGPEIENPIVKFGLNLAASIFWPLALANHVVKSFGLGSNAFETQRPGISASTPHDIWRGPRLSLSVCTAFSVVVIIATLLFF